jgi:hypothetical protein
MRAKKAKALRSMAVRLGDMEGLPMKAYTATEQYNGKGEAYTDRYAIILDDCVRRTYLSMKARYKTKSWK